MLIGKLLTHELTIKQRGDEQEEKKEKKKSIALKASQNDSEKENLEDSSEKDGEITTLIRNFKKFLRKQHSSRTRDNNKKYEGDSKKKTKEVTCYEYKKPGHIQSECPKLKFKNKGAKDKTKAFKGSWDDFSKSEKEEEQ